MGPVAALLTIGFVTLVVARISRLLTIDKVFESPRKWLIKRRGSDSMVVFLAHCPVCTSVWVGFFAGVVLYWLTAVGGVLNFYGVGWWLFVPGYALAASWFVTVTQKWEP